MDVLILFGLILLNGVLAMSEIALVAARRPRLLARAARGQAGARAALRLAQDPNRFLSTVQIGITSIGLLNGIVGQSVFAAPLAAVMEHGGLSARSASALATALVVIVVTYVSIVIGELVPKRWAQIHAESISCLVARPMRGLSILTTPFVWLLSVSTEILLRVLRIDAQSRSGVTEEEIQTVLSEGSMSGAIDGQEHALMRNALRLDDRPLHSFMTPRADVRFVDLRNPVKQILAQVIESPHARLPVCRGDLSRLVGVIEVREVLAQIAAGQEPDLSGSLDNCAFLLESLTGLELMRQFRDQHLRLVFVVDEYGEVEGLVTPDDLLHALTGGLYPSDPGEVEATRDDDGTWQLAGTLDAGTVAECLALAELPRGDDRDYQTLAGMLMTLLDHVPEPGDTVNWAGWRFEIQGMQGQRIVRVRALQAADASADTGTEVKE